MRLEEQARVCADQLVLNRVAQAVVVAALDLGKAVPGDLDGAAKRAARLLAAQGDAWLSDDDALVAGVKAAWKRL
jgi:hypothetical protein